MQSKTLIWKTKDGRKIPIREMTDSHLNNAITHTERKFAEKRQQLIVELQDKIADFESNLDKVRFEIGLSAQVDYHELGFIDSGLAAAFAFEYDEEWEAHLNRLEHLKQRLELLKAGDPRGVSGYQELLAERNRRKGM